MRFAAVVSAASFLACATTGAAPEMRDVGASCFKPDAPEFRFELPAGMTLAEGLAKGLVGSLEKEHIRAVIREHLASVKGCYDEGLRDAPHAQGRVVIQFVVSGTGTVAVSRIAESSLGLPAVEQCIARQSCAWQFSPPRGGGEVIVTYPFALSPGGDTAPPSSPPDVRVRP
jgi:TonB family protein